MKLNSYFLTHCTFFGLFSILLIACRVAGNEVGKGEKITQNRIESSTGDTIPNTTVPENSPRIIFLTYSIKKISGQERYSLHLIDEIIAKGKVKGERPATIAPQVGDLKCVALDADEQAITETVIPDPLNQVVEYVSDEGSLAKKAIALDSAQFSLRLPLFPSTKFIAIERIDLPNGQSSRLLLTQIN